MIPLLDHGYVRRVETWGSDAAIIEAARMSTQKGFLGWEPEYRTRCPVCLYEYVGEQNREGMRCPNQPVHDCEGTLALISSHPGDAKLLAFLYNNNHLTPFEMAGMVIEVKAPIFVFREWHRHRTQSYNEMSARYIPLPDENYVPSIQRLMMGQTGNKQAGAVKGTPVLTEAQADNFRRTLYSSYLMNQTDYDAALAHGVPKELARILLPVARYSIMRASANLRNWLAFLTLRMDEKAQWEIRQYANAVGTLIQESFPRTWELFDTKRMK